MKYTKIMLLVLITVLSALLATSTNVSANTGGGSGGDGTGQGGSAGWYFASGPKPTGNSTSAAWKALQKTKKASSIDYAFNTKISPIGFNSRKEMRNACEKSQFIWWFGTKSSWHTEIGVGQHPAISKLPGYDNDFAKPVLQAFKELNPNGWTNKGGGAVIICSHGVPPIDQGGKITFTANSGSFLYDGKTHEVNGYKMTSGKLNSGHSFSVKPQASGKRKSVGNGKVNFTRNAKIVNNSGKDITNLYTIKYNPGKIDIIDRIEGDNKRCKTTSSDTIYKNTQNQANISEGFAPIGAEGKYDVGNTAMYNNKAYDYTRSFPKGGGLSGDLKSKWISWAKGLNAIPDDLTTNSLALSGTVSDTLQKHGGVIDVTRTNHDTRFNVEFCQPQEREQYLDKNNKPKWTSWKNFGKERIKTVKRKDKARDTKYSYQILGVNCNAEGLAMVKSKYDTVDLSHGEASGLVETKPTKGLNFPLGKAGDGIGTNKDVFYNPDGVTWKNSCKDTFKEACVSTKLSSSAKNDADKNLGNSPKFTHEDSEEYKDNNPKGHSYPSEDGELNFFRDNEERVVRADVWYLDKMTKSGFITDPNSAAKKTTARVFAGTPEAEITDIIPIDVEGNRGSKLLKKSDDIGKDISFNNHTSKLGMKSKWASEKDKPYEIGLNWTYEAAVENVGPNEVNGHKVENVTSKKKFTFDAQCAFQNDNGKYPANMPDNPFLDKGSNISPKWDGSGKIKALFTRSVSDKVTDDTKNDN